MKDQEFNYVYGCSSECRGTRTDPESDSVLLDGDDRKYNAEVERHNVAKSSPESALDKSPGLIYKSVERNLELRNDYWS